MFIFVREVLPCILFHKMLLEIKRVDFSPFGGRNMMLDNLEMYCCQLLPNV